ncbi:hypothetical protein [Halpernia sp.]|uniref:hypothetical protein n=1 Tax=Halpernia sp. TaxID=2782209 RepID=UPI003A90F42B
MKKIILSALLGLTIVVSCEKKQKHKDHQENTTMENHGMSENHATEEEHSETTKLELNNCTKWAMNAEMKPFINQMESEIKRYKPEIDDYKTLGKTIETTNENLVKSCTMKGTPHEVLHAWLHPHMELIEDLNKAANKEEANKIVGNLKHSMETYHQYFD